MVRVSEVPVPSIEVVVLVDLAIGARVVLVLVGVGGGARSGRRREVGDGGGEGLGAALVGLLGDDARARVGAPQVGVVGGEHEGLVVVLALERLLHQAVPPVRVPLAVEEVVVSPAVLLQVACARRHTDDAWHDTRASATQAQ